METKYVYCKEMKDLSKSMKGIIIRNEKNLIEIKIIQQGKYFDDDLVEGMILKYFSYASKARYHIRDRPSSLEWQSRKERDSKCLKNQLKKDI